MKHFLALSSQAIYRALTLNSHHHLPKKGFARTPLVRTLVIAVLIVAAAVSRSEARTYFMYDGAALIKIPAFTRINRSGDSYTFLLRRVNGFSPNVNVQLQSYPGNIFGYATLSMRQFRSLNFRVLRQRFLSGGRGWEVEYLGIIGRPLRFYSRAFEVSDSGGILLLTATNTIEDWDARRFLLLNMLASVRFW